MTLHDLYLALMNIIPIRAAVVVALVDNSGGAAANGTIGAVTAPSALTDNSGGTASTTLEDCNNAVTGVDGTASNAASKTDVDARLVSIANNFADLAARQAENRTAIVALTDAITELATKVNEHIANQKTANLMHTS